MDFHLIEFEASVFFSSGTKCFREGLLITNVEDFGLSTRSKEFQNGVNFKVKRFNCSDYIWPVKLCGHWNEINEIMSPKIHPISDQMIVLVLYRIIKKPTNLVYNLIKGIE